MDHDELWQELTSEGPGRGDYRAVLERYDREKAEENSVEMAAFSAIMDADYTEAKMIVRGMAAKDRAVLVFWAKELIGVADAVDLDEVRY